MNLRSEQSQSQITNHNHNHILEYIIGSLSHSPHASRHTVEETEAEEGPFPVDLKSALIAEVFGTAMLVQIGCAANCVALYTQSFLGMGEVATVWAVATAVAIYATAALSGGHLNPAISFGFALVRPADFSFRRLIPYWMAQLLGAFVAGSINLFLFHRAIAHFEKKHAIVRGDAASIESAAAFGDYWSLHSKDCANGVHAFFVEAFGTAVLGFVVFALTHHKNPIPGSAVPAIVGGVYGVLVATLGPLTGYV